MVGIGQGAEEDFRRVACFIQTELHIRCLKVNRPMLKAFAAQLFGQFIQHEQCLLQLLTSRLSGVPDDTRVVGCSLASRLLQHGLRLLVGQSAIRMYDGSADLVTEHLGLVVHFHNDGHAEFIFVGAETTEFVA